MCWWGWVYLGETIRNWGAALFCWRGSRKKKNPLNSLLLHSVVLFHGGKKIVERAEGDVVSFILSLATFDVSVGLVGEPRCFRKGFLVSSGFLHIRGSCVSANSVESFLAKNS